MLLNTFRLSAVFLLSWPMLVFAQVSLNLQASPGWQIHDASYLPRPSYWPPAWEWDGSGLNDDTSYRYGPALIRYNGNHLHFWACSEGDPDENIADYIRYKHSSDGGVTWGEEVIAMAPTVGTADGWAICDPNVVKFGNYFYMAYTATDNSDGGGLNNHVFIARSTRPDGGFEKWNGSGWGGNPQPIIRYNGPVNRWGYGEPNMVIKGSTLFLYYSDHENAAKTRVATAIISNPDWPANLIQRGAAIASRAWAEDQTDVKYLPEVNRFIAAAIGSRFSEESYVHVWQSSDGLRFQPIDNDVVRQNIKKTAHNLGMSGSFLGHAEMGRKEYIAYAYNGPEGEWGRWNAWLNPVNITGAGWAVPVTPPTPEEPPARNLVPIIMLLLDEDQ